ncbi:uncharacterized protein LOC129594588 [Paramacrobiotus metropolitanus]|uniref:uncharacterized protein LOC129594588 n=1 Tax=Paramacrobiotus metropolitanus TaxID=2943436 RepID=UPI0024455F1A|nr:uncharacterized protein LOC129594588 [Paramacrobiotus metropolitanus]
MFNKSALLFLHVFAVFCFNNCRMKAVDVEAKEGCSVTMNSEFSTLAALSETDEDFHIYCHTMRQITDCLNITVVNHPKVAASRANIMALNVVQGVVSKVCSAANASRWAQEYTRCHNATAFAECAKQLSNSSDLSAVCRDHILHYECFVPWTKNVCSPEAQQYHDLLHDIAVTAQCTSETSGASLRTSTIVQPLIIGTVVALVVFYVSKYSVVMQI